MVSFCVLWTHSIFNFLISFTFLNCIILFEGLYVLKMSLNFSQSICGCWHEVFMILMSVMLCVVTQITSWRTLFKCWTSQLPHRTGNGVVAEMMMMQWWIRKIKMTKRWQMSCVCVCVYWSVCIRQFARSANDVLIDSSMLSMCLKNVSLFIFWITR